MLVEGSMGKHIHKSDDTVHGRANLVTHGSQEGRFCPIGVLCFTSRGGQRLDNIATGSDIPGHGINHPIGFSTDRTP